MFCSKKDTKICDINNINFLKDISNYLLILPNLDLIEKVYKSETYIKERLEKIETNEKEMNL